MTAPARNQLIHEWKVAMTRKDQLHAHEIEKQLAADPLETPQKPPATPLMSTECLLTQEPKAPQTGSQSLVKPIQQPITECHHNVELVELQTGPIST